MARKKNTSLNQLVTKLIDNCTKALEKKELKVTIADLFRLRELQKELAPVEFVSPKVTWLDNGLDSGLDGGSDRAPQKALNTGREITDRP